MSFAFVALKNLPVVEPYRTAAFEDNIPRTVSTVRLRGVAAEKHLRTDTPQLERAGGLTLSLSRYVRRTSVSMPLLQIHDNKLH
jgi:hypothetical protein